MYFIYSVREIVKENKASGKKKRETLANISVLCLI